MDAEQKTLDDPLGIGEVDDVGAATKTYVFGQHRTVFFLSIAVCVCLLPVMIFFAWSDYQIGAATGNFDPRVILIVFAPFLIPGMVYAHYRARVQKEFLEQMAQAIGYTYSPSAPMETVVGSTFTIGHDRSIKDVMTGTYKDHPARLYSFSFTIGYGKGSRTETLMVFELAYPSPLPHVLLNLVDPDEGVPSDVESVQLEGDFNSYFKLYVSKGAQMEIREIFQPDTMQEFIEQFRTLSMEICGSKIYLIQRGPMTGNRQTFLNMQTVMDSVFDRILPSLTGVGTDTAAASAIVQMTQ